MRVLEHRHSSIYAVSDGSWHAVPERNFAPRTSFFPKIPEKCGMYVPLIVGHHQLNFVEAAKHVQGNNVLSMTAFC